MPVSRNNATMWTSTASAGSGSGSWINDLDELLNTRGITGGTGGDYYWSNSTGVQTAAYPPPQYTFIGPFDNTEHREARGFVWLPNDTNDITFEDYGESVFGESAERIMESDEDSNEVITEEEYLDQIERILMGE